MLSSDYRRAKRIIVAQAVTSLLIAAVGFAFGVWTAIAALLGGAIATIGNALFALWVFGRYRADDPGKLTGQFYGGEFLKLGFIAITFAVVILWLKPFSPVAFFGAFLIVQVVPPMLANRLGG